MYFYDYWLYRFDELVFIMLNRLRGGLVDGAGLSSIYDELHNDT